MFGFIAAGAVAIVLAMLVGLRNVAVMTGFAEFVPTGNTDAATQASLISLLWEWLSHHTFSALTAFAVVMLLLAWLMRKVVLAGLRD